MTDTPEPNNRSIEQSWSRRFVLANRASIGTMAVFVVMMVLFFIGNPAVFSDYRIYYSVLTTLPVAIFVVVPMVFLVTVGEIDLAFPAVMALSAWIFALSAQAGIDPLPGAANPGFRRDDRRCGATLSKDCTVTNRGRCCSSTGSPEGAHGSAATHRIFRNPAALRR